MSEWISVDERLPDENERVICYGTSEYGDQSNKFVAPGYRWVCRDENRWSTLEWDGVGGNEWFGTVTHWMPLPEPPILSTPNLSKDKNTVTE